MNKRIILLPVIFLIIIGLVALFYSYSQEDNEITVIQQILQEHINEVNKWERTANFLIFLTIMVAVLGVVTGVLQKFDKKWCKIATIIAGAVISLITIINNTVFQVDHRTLRGKAREARKYIHDIRLLLAQNMNLNDEEARQFWLNEIKEKLHNISDLETELYSTNVNIQLVSSAHAQTMKKDQQQPPWITNPPSDKTNLYFVGIGESRSPSQAKEYSFNNAIEQTVDYLIMQFQIKQQAESTWNDIKALSEELANSARKEDTYLNYDSGDSLFHYYTLLALNKEFADTIIRIFFGTKGASTSQEVSKTLKNAPNPSQDYFTRKSNIYKTFFEIAKDSLSAPFYEKFIEARQLRKNSDYEKSINLLKQVLHKNPRFYLGWFNLALAYDALNDFPLANEAYKRSVQLEPKQPLRDASLYSTYGNFLFRHKKYSEAIDYLKRALEIEPDHPTAKKNLQAAEEAANR